MPISAIAQGCGPTNPNCIVPTAPAGTNDKRAASTEFVQTEKLLFPALTGYLYANGSSPITASTTIPTIGIANSAVTAAKMASGAAVANIGYTPVNRAGDTMVGQLNTLNLYSSAPPLITQTYAFTSILTALDFDLTAISATMPEQTVAFRMTSNTGGGTTTTYKSAFGAETICSSASSPCWAGTTALTTNSGYALTKSQISFEVDHNNNSGSNCTDVDYGTTGAPCVSLYVTGAGTNQISAAIGVGGNNQVRSGIAFYTGGTIAADIRSFSAAINFIQDTGSHSNFIDASGGACSSNFILSPSTLFVVTCGGALTATSVASNKYLNTSASPSLSSCGTSPTVSANSTNSAGQITTGTGAPTSCTMTFANPYPTAAFCTIHAANAAAAGSGVLPYISASSASAFTITMVVGTSSASFNYVCMGK